jgi:tetratricopeptide (TPR) repeat protein
MPNQGKRSDGATGQATPGSQLQRLAEQSQIDFEIDFFGALLARYGCYVDALRVHGNNLTLKGRHAEGLQIDKKLVQLRPNDPNVHYNLACSYAIMKQPELALKTLRRAVELGYRDFRYMREDRDLATIRHDPRFKQLLREFESR